jgi:hypothetical protein
MSTPSGAEEGHRRTAPDFVTSALLGALLWDPRRVAAAEDFRAALSGRQSRLRLPASHACDYPPSGPSRSSGRSARAPTAATDVSAKPLQGVDRTPSTRTRIAMPSGGVLEPSDDIRLSLLLRPRRQH